MTGVHSVPVAGEVVAACCGDHRPAGCCGEACEPCCAECPTCPAVRIERYAKTSVAAIDGLEFDTLLVIEVTAVFNPDGLADAAHELARIDLPHFEGSLT